MFTHFASWCLQVIFHHHTLYNVWFKSPKNRSFPDNSTKTFFTAKKSNCTQKSKHALKKKKVKLCKSRFFRFCVFAEFSGNELYWFQHFVSCCPHFTNWNMWNTSPPHQVVWELRLQWISSTHCPRQNLDKHEGQNIAAVSHLVDVTHLPGPDRALEHVWPPSFVLQWTPQNKLVGVHGDPFQFVAGSGWFRI